MLGMHTQFAVTFAWKPALNQPDCTPLPIATGTSTTASAEILITTDICLKAFDEEGHSPLGLSLLVNYDLPSKRVCNLSAQTSAHVCLPVQQILWAGTNVQHLFSKWCSTVDTQKPLSVTLWCPLDCQHNASASEPPHQMPFILVTGGSCKAYSGGMWA